MLQALVQAFNSFDKDLCVRQAQVSDTSKHRPPLMGPTYFRQNVTADLTPERGDNICVGRGQTTYHLSRVGPDTL